MAGRTWKFGDHINTDDIVPARYLNTSDPKELASHCMQDYSPTFAGEVNEGDVMVAGENFGCGSSREHAPVAIKASGVTAVVARSFARIFLRNCVNMGLPAIVCPEATEKINEGDEVTVDLAAGTITDATTGEAFSFDPYPPELQEIIDAGGLMPYVAGMNR